MKFINFILSLINIITLLSYIYTIHLKKLKENINITNIQTFFPKLNEDGSKGNTLRKLEDELNNYIIIYFTGNLSHSCGFNPSFTSNNEVSSKITKISGQAVKMEISFKTLLTDCNQLISKAINYIDLITEIDASNFDTSLVTDMRNMFDGCIQMESIDVSKFNT